MVVCCVCPLSAAAPLSRSISSTPPRASLIPPRSPLPPLPPSASVSNAESVVLAQLAAVDIGHTTPRRGSSCCGLSSGDGLRVHALIRRALCGGTQPNPSGRVVAQAAYVRWRIQVCRCALPSSSVLGASSNIQSDGIVRGLNRKLTPARTILRVSLPPVSTSALPRRRFGSEPEV